MLLPVSAHLPESAFGSAQPPAAPEDMSVSPKKWTNRDNFDVSWKNPEGASPIVGAYYKLDDPPTGPQDGTYVPQNPRKPTGKIKDIEVHLPGNHRIFIWLKDQDGGSSHRNRAVDRLKFDDTAPEAPVDLTVSPNGWVVEDNFTVSWTIPDTGGMAPVVGAYYKLDALPDGPEDGSYVPISDGDAQVALFGIAVKTPGDHPIYVWLEDRAGNISQANIAEGHLLYAPPSVPPAPGQPDGGGAEADLPRITVLGVSRKYFRVGELSSKSSDRGYRVGTEIGFTLSRPSDVTFTVVRNIPGRKLGDTCRKVRRRQRNKRFRCAIFKTVGSFTRAGSAGGNSFKFTGWVNDRRLKPGLYHVYARIGKGSMAAAPKLFSFRVVHER